MSFTYLATPYSHKDPEIMESRFEIVCKVAGALMQRGEIVFSPIAHTHPIAVRCNLPRGWDFWHEYDLAFIEKCSNVLVVPIDGWELSKGIAAEVAIALKIGKPVKFMEPDEFEKLLKPT